MTRTFLEAPACQSGFDVDKEYNTINIGERRYNDFYLVTGTN